MMNAPQNLIDAVTTGDAYELERLLELTSDPDIASAYTEDGWSLLHLAPTRPVADLLISHGADINAPNRHKVFGPGNRPLHAAVYMDRPDVVDALIHAAPRSARPTTPVGRPFTSPSPTAAPASPAASSRPAPTQTRE